MGHLTAVRHHLDHKISRLVVGRDDCSSVFDVHMTSCTADDRVCGYLLDVHAPADLQVCVHPRGVLHLGWAPIGSGAKFHQLSRGILRVRVHD